MALVGANAYSRTQRNEHARGINISRDLPIRKLVLLIFSAGRPLSSHLCLLLAYVQVYKILGEQVFAYVEDTLGCVI